MSRLKLVKIKDECFQHAHWYASSGESGHFGGIFINLPSPWRTGQGARFTHFSVTRMFSSGISAGTKSFRKFRHAKKCLSKWVNP